MQMRMGINDMKEIIKAEEYKQLIISFRQIAKVMGKEWGHYKTFKRLLESMDIIHRDLLHIIHAIDQSIIVAITDNKGKILNVNEKFCKLSGYSRNELIGHTHRIVNSGHHDKSFFTDMWNTLRSGKTWSGEIKNKAKDSSFYWVKSTIVPVLSKEGMPYMYISLRTDITQGKKIEEQLVNALKNDFKQIVNSMHNLVFKVSKDELGNFIYLFGEGKLAHLLGVITNVIYKRGPKELFSSDVAEVLEKSYEQAFEGNTITYSYPLKNRYLLSTISPIYENGKIVELIGCCNDITELNKAQNEMKFMAFHDTLTNLPNRRKFNRDITYFINHSQQKTRLALFFINLNRFKHVNDSLGHQVGDRLLKAVTKRLLTTIRGNEKLYRFTGDQFIITHIDMDENVLLEHLAKSFLSVFDKPFQVDEALSLYSTGSIGVSVYPDHGQDAETLLKNAEVAMNAAKTQKINTYCEYQPHMNRHFDEYLLIENYLPVALKNDEFDLHFQPKLDLKTNSINGMEALLRWNHPILGNVPPGTFIPIAEDAGLIIQLDEWVLKKACLQIKKWNNDGLQHPLRVAVNISPHHFGHPNFAEMVKKVITETNIDPEWLELEITESAFMENTAECVECIKRLRETGVSVSIDDFGTGYSSLTYLRNFPINHLKIDQSFIKEMIRNSQDIAIVKAIIYLAHELKVKVVAEGVEEKESLECLRLLGCDEIQGYYVGRPVPSSEFKMLLSNQSNDKGEIS